MNHVNGKQFTVKALSLLVLQNITRQLGLVNGQKFAVKIQLLKVKETAWKNKMQCTTAVGFIKFFIIFVTVWQRGMYFLQYLVQFNVMFWQNFNSVAYKVVHWSGFRHSLTVL